MSLSNRRLWSYKKWTVAGVPMVEFSTPKDGPIGQVTGLELHGHGGLRELTGQNIMTHARRYLQGCLARNQDPAQ